MWQIARAAWRFLFCGISLALMVLATANMVGIAALMVGMLLMHYVPWALAIAPGILISMYIYWRDHQEQEPHPYLIKAFILGALSTYPAIKLEEFWIYQCGVVPSAKLSMTLAFAFGVVAFSEEVAKFFVLRVFFVSKREFDEPMDGIVYSVLVGMGFATLENILYVIFRDGGTSVAFMRMFTAVPAHAAFAIAMGYFVGLSKFTPSKNWRYVFAFASLVVPVLIHGLYDFFIFQRMNQLLAIFTFVTLILSIMWSRRLISEHESQAHLYYEDSKHQH